VVKLKVLMFFDSGIQMGGCGCWIGWGYRFIVPSWKYLLFYVKIFFVCQVFVISSMVFRYCFWCSIGVML